MSARGPNQRFRSRHRPDLDATVKIKLFQAAYGYIQVFVFSTLYLAPAVYPIIFGFMLRDVQIFLRKLFSCFFTPEPEKCPDYSPSMQTRLTHASRTVTPMGTPELP